MTTNFLQWNPGAISQETDPQYSADTMRSGGAVSGVFAKETANKLFFQVSTMCAALGQAMSDKGYTVADTDLIALTAVLANIVTLATSDKQYIPPTGLVAPFAGATAPTGWLLCYGQQVGRSGSTGYPNLFAVIGTTYGVGDGSTTFNLPDLRGRAAIGLDNLGGSAASRVAAATALAQAAGTETHHHQGPSHTHGGGTLESQLFSLNVVPYGWLDGTTLPIGATGYAVPYGNGTVPPDAIETAETHLNITEGATAAEGTEDTDTKSNLDPYIAMSYIIKT